MNHLVISTYMKEKQILYFWSQVSSHWCHGLYEIYLLWQHMVSLHFMMEDCRTVSQMKLLTVTIHDNSVCRHAFSLDFPKIDTRCPYTREALRRQMATVRKTGASNNLSLVSCGFIIRFTKGGWKAGNRRNRVVSVGLHCLGYPNHDFHRNLTRALGFVGKSCPSLLCIGAGKGPTDQQTSWNIMKPTIM